MDAILQFSKAQMPTPTNYGWFHLLFFALTIGLTVFLCLRYRNTGERTFRRILLIGWLVILALELYKQITFVGIQGEPGSYHWEYQWYAFPFQFCSTPHYILPFIIFCKPGKLRNACMAFVTTFAMFAGLCVLFYPNDVFVGQIGINIQTMVHHGLQVVFGVYVAVYNRKHLGMRWYLSSLPVYGVMVAVAMLLNAVVPLWIGEQTFNMFYVSWRYPCTLPLLNILYPVMPYPLFLLMYVIGFAFAALVVFAITFGITKLVQACTKKTA